MKAAVNVLLCLGMGASFLRYTPHFAHDPSFPALFHLAERVCSFFPFFFLQLLCLVNIQRPRGRLFPLLLCLAVLALGFAAVILYFSDASGILIIILTMYFTAIPLLGSMAALAVWAVLGWLVCGRRRRRPE